MPSEGAGGVGSAAYSLAVPNSGVASIATLPSLFADHALCSRPRADTRAVLAWGYRPSARKAEQVAARHGLPLWRLEDAFLRSLAPGQREAPLGVVVDDTGIYYDAGEPSRLEGLVLGEMPPGAQARAESLKSAWVAGRVSKYNDARETPPAVSGPFALVVDQTAGDASIAHGRASPADFARMLEAALDEHPTLPVVLKVHPEVATGRKRGHFEQPLTPTQAARVTVVGDAVHAPALIERACAVYTVTSQVGFEALLWGKPVRTFGLPFYAGWGLTRDEQVAPARRRPAPLWRLVYAALVSYARYVDPETGARCEPERIVEWLALQRRMRERFAPQVTAVDFSLWKKPIVRAFFAGSDVRFVRSRDRVSAGATVVVWGRRQLPRMGGPPARVVRLEDGFIRSVGLGTELVRPLSWVLDDEGIYYDATAPSALESVLAHSEFDEKLLARARALRERLVSLGVSKYNVGEGVWRRPAAARRVVLVAGQVETDASIALGSPTVRTNLELLAQVRNLEPDAYVVYKPHPDVVAGLRRAGRREDAAATQCDEVVTDVPIDALFEQVDALHVMTSLAGFEALLRGRRVVAHGCPFYAGWGLTDDRVACPRRGRALSLDALVAAALILYPTYVSRVTGCFTTPERAVEEIEQWRRQSLVSPSMRRGLVRLLLATIKR